MEVRHIPGALFEEVFWDTVDHFILIGNFADRGNDELVINAVSELWARRKKAKNESDYFAQLLLEICASTEGSFEHILSKTDYTPCWLVFQVLLEIKQILNEMVVKGYYKTSSPDKTDYEPPDDNYYGMKFPNWFSDGIITSMDDGLSLNKRLEAASLLFSGNKTNMITFTECAQCCVLKPDIWIPRRVQQLPEKKITALEDLSKYREF